jgi:hypothetical protein
MQRVRNEELHGAFVPGGGVGILHGLRLGLFRMERRHGTVHEMENQRDEDQGDEKAPEKEFAGMRLIIFKEQAVHGEIDTGRREKCRGNGLGSRRSLLGQSRK